MERTAPLLNPENAPFFEAAKSGRFMIRRCVSCKEAHWYPRSLCPFCFGSTEWEDASGVGTVYSYSVMRRVPEPYAIAYVTLQEGPTMLTNIVNCDLDAIRIGMSVKVVMEPTTSDLVVPCFTPQG